MTNPELVAWTKDGILRREVLGVLSQRDCLPSEIARILRKHRSSISRTLGELEKKGLAYYVSANSRTKLYRITKSGKEILRESGFAPEVSV